MKKEQIIRQLTLDEKLDLLMFDQVISTHGIEEKGIPVIDTSDGPHGIRKLDYITAETIDGGDVCFPTGSALGATWNKDIAYKTGEAIAENCIREGIKTILGPGVNMKRTPKCGRNFEYFSEDPCLSGTIAAGYINGVESKNVGTCLKHFAANNQETDRGYINVDVDERTLREYYLAPFEKALELSNPSSVMCAYNKINGFWCSENKNLLIDILRKEWGYNGLIMSDCGAVHNGLYALKSGIDLVMPKREELHEEIKQGIKEGYITEDEIDEHVGNMLDFIDKVKEPQKTEFDRAKLHFIATEAASEAITLLKNENNVLPITETKYKKVAIIGDYAVNPLFMGGGSSKVSVEKKSVDIPFECLRDGNEKIEFEFIPFNKDVNGFYDENAMHAVNSLDGFEAANGFDMAVVFIGDNVTNDCETESFDRNNIHFTNFVDKVCTSVCEKFENSVIVMQSGSAMIPFRWENKAKAIIQMWMTGEGAGQAIADILLGKVNPSGKLSETFANKERTDIDLGDGVKVEYKEKMFVGYRYYDLHQDEVWYPFGHGISYTKYEYSNMRVVSNNDGDAKISVDITNVGDMDGKEVVQLYVSAKDSNVVRPIKELKGFEKIFIKKGETETVSFKLTRRDLSYYNVNLKEWYADAGKYDIMIGASSADIRLTTEIELNEDILKRVYKRN